MSGRFTKKSIKFVQKTWFVFFQTLFTEKKGLNVNEKIGFQLRTKNEYQ